MKSYFIKLTILHLVIYTGMYFLFAQLGTLAQVIAILHGIVSLIITVIAPAIVNYKKSNH